MAYASVINDLRGERGDVVAPEESDDPVTGDSTSACMVQKYAISSFF